jgi:hypothetical protein
MTTIKRISDTDTLEIVNAGRKAHIAIRGLLSTSTDCDLIEAINYAWQHPDELVTVPSISNARGLRPSAAVKRFVQ